MVENDQRDGAIYVPGFVKVVKCYESVIDAYVARCKKKHILPNEHGDDLYKAQMQGCRNMHASWVNLHRPAQQYDIDVVNAMSMAVNALIYEKLEVFRIREEVINED